jgi:hypothetical protein
MQQSRIMTRALVPLSIALRGVAAAFSPPMHLSSRAFSMSASASPRGGGRSWRGMGMWSPGAAALFIGAGASAQLSLRGEDSTVKCRAATSMSAETPQAWDAKPAKHTTGMQNEMPGGALAQEHFFHVPLDYFDPSRGTIEVFAR